MTALLSYLAMSVVAALIFGLVCRDRQKASQQDKNVRFWDDIQEWMDEENPAAGSSRTTGVKPNRAI